MNWNKVVIFFQTVATWKNMINVRGSGLQLVGFLFSQSLNSSTLMTPKYIWALVLFIWATLGLKNLPSHQKGIEACGFVCMCHSVARATEAQMPPHIHKDAQHQPLLIPRPLSKDPAPPNTHTKPGGLKERQKKKLCQIKAPLPTHTTHHLGQRRPAQHSCGSGHYHLITMTFTLPLSDLYYWLHREGERGTHGPFRHFEYQHILLQ